jgi:hypothetical protein
MRFWKKARVISSLMSDLGELLGCLIVFIQGKYTLALRITALKSHMHTCGLFCWGWEEDGEGKGEGTRAKGKCG